MTKNNEDYTTTSEQVLLKLQAKVKSFVDKAGRPISFVDELIEMRRAEAKNTNTLEELSF